MKFFQILVLLAGTIFFHMENAMAVQVISPGSTAVIAMDPVLPKEGEPFTINITGKWRDRCIPDQSELTYEMSDFTQTDRPEIKGLSIRIQTTLNRTDYCGNAFEPTDYKLSLPVQSSEWNRIDVVLEILDSPLGERSIFWQRNFDLILGLHEIPPRLGSGNWISEDTPFQGVLVQQQGRTVVFHELKYNRTSGEPNWHYADGKFAGNSLNGVAYLVNWLSPVEGATRGQRGTPENLTFYNRLVQPETQDLAFEASSAGISVNGVNRISIFVGLHDVDGEPQPVYHTYKRWVFDRNDTQLPPIVPDMAGTWNLYGFDGQKLKQSYQIEFKTGSKVGDDLYRFFSTADGWVLDCQINPDGEGDCDLVNESFGLALNYYIYKATYDPKLDLFNGNYAKAPLVHSNSTEPDQTGILLRSGVSLPVLDQH